MHSFTLGAAALGLLFGSNVQASPMTENSMVKRQVAAQDSPQYPLFSKALPIPPVKQPRMILTNPETGGDIWYYEVEIKNFKEQVYPGLAEADLVGYDGISPGPTFMVPRGTESVIRFVNHADHPNSVHLHGSYSRAAFDGWAEDTTQPGQYKDYYYPNRQSGRTIWYHDHAVNITAENAYHGQAGMYILTDPAVDAALNLPAGYGEFDIPIVLSSKRYNADGTLYDTFANNFYGDVIHVNGVPWPFMNVQPRKYRFRILDAAISRSFGLYFADSENLSAPLPFHVIASDSGLLEAPVETKKLYISMSERYEIVFDFSQFAGKTIEFKNLQNKTDNLSADGDFTNTDKVLRFHVADELDEPDTSVLPAQLRDVPYPDPTDSAVKEFQFAQTNGVWTINGKRFNDPANRILERPALGTVQRWKLINRGGGWTHPVHIHLVDFRVISRESTQTNGVSRGVMPYETGLKDVVWLAAREQVVVEAHYAPFPYVYYPLVPQLPLLRTY
jgi:bilirubin oxidase